MDGVRNRALIYRQFGPPADVLRLEETALPPLEPGRVRAQMSFAPVNPSDLIPVTGAYAHRIRLPMIAGYEGVGRVVEAPASHAHLLGRRVLPLRGAGTWQTFVDADPDLVVPIPDDLDDLVAARAYINPLTALLLLGRWPVAGKRVLLTGAGSTCAELLGRWALERGAAAVQGVYRSENRVEALRAHGIEPLSLSDLPAVRAAAERADVTFDALGGPVGSAILSRMRGGTEFVGYGLLSGQGLQLSGPPQATYHRFHLRDTLAGLSAAGWQREFTRVWAALRTTALPPVQVFPLHEWRRALAAGQAPGAAKAVLDFRASGSR